MNKNTLYPLGMRYVDPNPDLVIYNVFYHNEIDTLFICYKNVKTGEQVMQEIPEPVIPVFIANKKMKRMEQLIKIKDTTRHFIRYNRKYKSDDLKALLYDYKEVCYTDQFGVKQYKRVYPNIPKKAYSLNPNLYGYGETIEQLILKEFALQRFEYHDGFASEVVPAFKLDISSFDIETIQEDNTTKININTFIDRKSLQAYALYVRDYEKYPYQDTIMQDVQLFIDETRNKLIEVIKATELQGSASDVEAIINKCVNIAENLTFNIIECATEEELILKSMEIMFDKHHPDILMAFNTPYDETNFQKRIEELGLPVGSMNIKKYRDVRPKFMEGMNTETWQMFGDSRSSKKRSCSFDVIRPTHVVDYQMIYYSNRSFNTFSSESLQNTAERELGFGKLDFSQWSNSVVTLPFKNFRIHLSYGLIDSILLLFLNEKLKDIESKILYTIITKNNIEQTVHSNPSISNWVFCSTFHFGYVNGVNMNKLLKRVTKEELEILKKATGIDFEAHRSNLPAKYLSQSDTETNEDEDSYFHDPDDDTEFRDRDIKIRGGIVSPPQNLLVNIRDFVKYKLLNNEVELSTFLKQEDVAYLDFKSHYPFTFIVRNLFMQCIKAEIVTLLSVKDKSIILSKNLYKNNRKYVENFGFLHMTIINDDIITYSNKSCGTPSLTELINTVMPLDSKPNFKPKELFNLELKLNNKLFDRFIQLMVKLDKSKFSDTEENFFTLSNTTFLPQNGSIKYYGSRIDYNYGDRDLISEMIFESTINEFKNENKEKLIFKRDKGKLVNCPELTLHPVKDLPNEVNFEEGWSEWEEVNSEVIKHIESIDFTSEPIRINRAPFIIFGTKNVFYYPCKEFLNQTKHEPQRTPFISPLCYRYFMREKTILIQFKFSISFRGINLFITQSMNILNIKIDMDKYNKEGKCVEI